MQLRVPQSTGMASVPPSLVVGAEQSSSTFCPRYKRHLLMLWGLGALVLCLLLLSLALGAVSLPVADLYHALVGSERSSVTADRLLWEIRMPRALLAVMVGVGFALSGLVLQVVIRNPLADPGVMGVSSGASLFVVVWILLADTLSIWFEQNLGLHLSIHALPIVAMLGGLFAAAMVLALTWRSGIHPARLALYGVALGSVFNGAVMWVVVGWGGGRTEITLMWLAGSLYGRSFDHVFIMLPWLLLSIAALWLLLKPLSVLRLGDEVGRGLGFSVHRWRAVAVAVAVILAASGVAVAGPIGFVGLVIPHLARLLVGQNIRLLVVASALCGACLMLVADLAGRLLVVPLELPVGALTTLIGIPVFLLLLVRSGRGAYA